MGEGLGCLLGWACVAVAVAKMLAGWWCLVELRRRWRSVPELWSVDWLDIVYRLERDLGVTLTAADFEGQPTTARLALTAGQLGELTTAKIRAAGREVPADGWERVVVALAEALNVKPRRITRGSRLYADLGMIYGLD